MAPTAKLVIGAALGGLMLAVAGISGTHRQPAPPVTIAIPEDEATYHNDLTRCRTITMPDSGCDAAWAEKRRHFFGKGSGK